MADDSGKLRVASCEFRVETPELVTRNSKRSCKGQALVELGIFGSFFIMLLGALLHYGFNYDANQRAAMKAFRKALALAAQPTQDGEARGRATYQLLQDVHIPNPQSPFGLGVTLPVTAASAVVRDWHQQDSPNEVDELPRTAIEIEGSTCPGSELSPRGSQPPCLYLTAGFRTEENVPQQSVPRYVEIFGRQNVCDRSDCGGGDGDCARKEINPQTGEKFCAEFAKQLRILDVCEGEIISLQRCFGQARRMVDSAFCQQVCEDRSDADPARCQDVCNLPMNPPWYAEWDPERSKPENHEYFFTKLFSLFAGIRRMGLQPGYGKFTANQLDAANRPIPNALEKSEDGSAISTTTSTNWRVDMRRGMVHKPYGDTSGNAVGDVIETSPLDERSPTTWTTPWH